MSGTSRRQFDLKLIELFDKKDQSSSHLTGDKYKWIINRLIALSVGDVKKVTKDYRLIKTYELVAIPYGGKTIQRLQKPGTNLLYVSHDDMFDTIREIHLASGHGARDVMHDRAKKQYVNLTKEVLQLYSDLCEECQVKKSNKVRRIFVDVKPVVLNILNFRCQVDIVDMQAQPDGNKHFIMNYQDYTTKFITLRPLRTNRVAEVANQLVEIFCTFGCPLILQSNYGRKYSRKVVREIIELWPECALVHGKSKAGVRDSHEGGTSQDIEIVLTRWMKENKTTQWSDGLRFVQWQQNNRKHLETNKTPFSSMFYENARLGLKSTNLTPEIIVSLDSEEDLEQVLNTTSVVLDNKSKEPVPLLRTEGLSRPLPNLVRMETPAIVGRTSDIITSTPEQTLSVLKKIAPMDGISLNLPIAVPGMMNVPPPVDLGKSNVPSEDTMARSGIHSGMMNVPPPVDLGKSIVPSEDTMARSGIHFQTICSVCEFAYVGSHKCSVCNNFCHEKPPCSKVINVPGSRAEVMCLLCERSKHDQCTDLYVNHLGEKTSPPNAKRYKHAPDNIPIGSSISAVDRIHMGVHGNPEGCVSPSFPMTDPKPAGHFKPFAYKARTRPALFKFNAVPNGQTLLHAHEDGTAEEGY